MEMKGVVPFSTLLATNPIRGRFFFPLARFCPTEVAMFEARDGIVPVRAWPAGLPGTRSLVGRAGRRWRPREWGC